MAQKLSQFLGKFAGLSKIKADLGGEGSSTSPGYVKLWGTDGTARYAYITTSGTWAISTSEPSSNAAGGDDTIYTATVTIPTASVLASFTTPYTLVAAPGVGKHLVYERAIFWHAAGTAYTSNDHTVKYTNISGASVSAALTASGFTTSASAQQRLLRNITTSLNPVTNAPLVFTTATADPTTGTFDILCEIKYRIVTDKI